MAHNLYLVFWEGVYLASEKISQFVFGRQNSAQDKQDDFRTYQGTTQYVPGTMARHGKLPGIILGKCPELVTLAYSIDFCKSQ